MRRGTRVLAVFLLVTGCTSQPAVDTESPTFADVTAVEVRGSARAYTFAVEIRSPDTGCDQYADWWEVVGFETGDLIHRRILAHSHVDEQPFTRPSGPVVIEADETVLVRAHLSTGGYGGQVFIGTADDGLTVGTSPVQFAADLATAPPQPDGCAF